MNEVAVVICNYNKRDYVIACIDSILASNFTDFDLVVVDNASTDGSTEAIQERFGKKLTLLVNEENTGGSGGFNRGMRFAMDKGNYQYIHLLDNDVIADKDAIGKLYEFMKENPETGVCGSLICRAQIRDRIQEYGANINIDILGVISLYGGQIADNSIPESVICDYVAACSAMYKVSVLQKTGIIDKDYFIYWDDMALSWDIRLAGYKVCAYAKSVVWHYGSYGERTAFSRYYSFRNKIYGFVKYLDDNDYENFCENLISMLFRIFAVNRDNSDYIQNYFHALNDALNNVRGKAQPYKIVSSDPENKKFIKAFSGKKKILILYDSNISEFDRLIDRIRKVTNAEIYVFTSGQRIPITDDIDYVADTDFGKYELVVQLCYHILDESSYDRSKIYIDKYANQIIDGEDFDFYENYAIHYEFFKDSFYGFVNSKLNILRKQLHNSNK